ncbi:MAG: TonB-dependent receptor [Sphingomonadaceae bacterium]
MTSTVSFRTISSRSLFLAGVATLATSFPAVAYAQETPAREESGFAGEIIVTATKRDQTLQEVPVAVTVTTAETIEREQIRDLKDLQTVVPSLKVTQLQSSANTNFIIRGFGNGANNAGIEPSVGVFVDGVYRSRSASQINDLPDVERIEVLRGPQSTLFGKNASAGVISIVTKKPSFETNGQMEMSIGNYDAMVVKGYVSGPVSDSFAVSVAGGVNLRDGYMRDYGTGNRTNNRDRWFMRAQALFDNDGPVTVRLIGDISQIDERCCAAVNVQSSGATSAIIALGGQVNSPSQKYDGIVFSNIDSTNDIENYGVSGQIDADLGPGTLTSITSWRRTNSITDQDSDFTSGDLIGHNYQDLVLKTFTQELRYNAEIGDRVNLLLGGYYFNEKVDQTNQLLYGNDFRNYANILIQAGTGGALNVGSLNPGQDLELIFGALDGNPMQYVGQFFAAGQGMHEAYTLKDESISLFGQVDFEVTDGLTLTLGGNYTRDKKHYSANVNSNDVFSAIDANAPQYAPFRYQLIYMGALGQGATPAQANAIAMAGMNDPAQNPLNALRPLQFLPPFVDVPNSVEPGKTKDSNFSYTARLAYDLNPNLNLYASYATGFKASSINLSRDSRPAASDAAALASAGLTVNNLRYGSRYAGPEKSKVIELGLKGNWGNYSANIAAFRQTINGFQSNTFTGTGFALANAGKQRTWGVEFEGRTNPIEQLSFDLGVTWLDAKYVSFPISSIGDLSGYSVGGVPEWSVTLGGQWDQELGNGDHLIARASYHYESETQVFDGLPGFLDPSLPDGGQAQAIAAAQPFTRQVDELAASLTYATDGGLEFSVWGRNLLNDRYLLSLFDSVAQSHAISSYPNQPRTYGVAVRARF